MCTRRKTLSSIPYFSIPRAVGRNSRARAIQLKNLITKRRRAEGEENPSRQHAPDGDCGSAAARRRSERSSRATRSGGGGAPERPVWSGDCCCTHCVRASHANVWGVFIWPRNDLPKVTARSLRVTVFVGDPILRFAHKNLRHNCRSWRTGLGRRLVDHRRSLTACLPKTKG